jgi:hypothetical protein
MRSGGAESGANSGHMRANPVVFGTIMVISGAMS